MTVMSDSAAATVPVGALLPTPPPQTGATTVDERNWGLLAHLSGFVWVLGVPGIVGPLIVWLCKREVSPFIDHHAKESLNFQISLLIYAAGLAVLGFIGALLTIVLIGYLLLIPVMLGAAALWIFQIVVMIMASVSANQGAAYYYPLTIRLIG